MAKILVIDSDKLVCDVLHDLLESMGHEAETAFSGNEGIELFASRPFDLVTTELNMPGMNGLRIGKHIKQESPCTPVALITCRKLAPILDTKNNMYIDLVLKKPLGYAELKEATMKLLFLRSARHKIFGDELCNHTGSL